MSVLTQVQALLPEMTYREKISLLGQIAQDIEQATPGIEQTPGVCGGVACIEGTRIPVWALMGYKKLGVSDRELLQAYPTIDAQNLAYALDYYRDHQKEIDEQIAENGND